jgi:hypothetical protein
MVAFFLLPVLSLITGLLNASEDIISHEKWDRSVFVFIDKWWRNLKANKNTKYRKYFFDQLMWKNKYEGRNPENSERKFLGFSFTWLTDWWHFSKSLRMLLEWLQLILAASLVSCIPQLWIIALITAGCFILRNITFTTFYHRVFLNEE